MTFSTNATADATVSRSRQLLQPGGVESAACGTAWDDWFTGTRHFEIWLSLAWYDVLLRYRRSLLGPLWLTLSMGALIMGMGPLYATLFNTQLSTFFPHLTLGIIFWSYLSGVIGEGCSTFISAASYLKQAPYSRSIFSWRIISRHTIHLLHHIVLFIPVAAWARLEPSTNCLLVLPGLAIVVLNLHALSLTLGFLSARFRDVPQIVSSVLQLLMFLTPVFWLPDALPYRARFILYNPLAAWLELLRSPLLGRQPFLIHWQVSLIFSIVNVVIACLMYKRCRQRVVYWI